MPLIAQHQHLCQIGSQIKHNQNSWLDLMFELLEDSLWLNHQHEAFGLQKRMIKIA